MGIGISLLAGVVIGVIVGVFITIPILFVKTWWEKRRAIKKQGKENILKAIKLQQEEQNAIQEKAKETRRRLGRGTGYGGGLRRGGRASEEITDEETAPEYPRTQSTRTGEYNSSNTTPKVSNQTSTGQRDRIQIPNPSFTLRD